MDGLTTVTERIAKLDAGLPASTQRNVSRDLERFIRVMQGTEDPSLVSISSAAAEDIDTLVYSCRLLSRVADVLPHVVDGPIQRSRQYWVGTGKPRHVDAPSGDLDRSSFVDVATAGSIDVSDKPFRVGLFTSTGIAGNHGMWRQHLDITQSSLFPKPWRTWAAVPQAGSTIREIRSAGDWVQFVRDHNVSDNRFLYPDWRVVSRRLDAVHMTLRAIVATQGVGFAIDSGIVAPTHWDVESTFWLRWCFESVGLVEETA